MSRPLVISHDTALLDDLLRLAAAAGVDVHVAPDVDAARAHWRTAPLIVLDVALASAVEGRLPRRDGLVLVQRADDVPAWRLAVAIGAEHIAELPDAERWLVARFADGGEGPSREGRLVLVRGAVGGAGTSTLATTLALVAAGQARTLLVDADASGAGLDLVLGAESTVGARWPDLAQAHGRVSAASLASALPIVRGVSLLSAARDEQGPLDPDVVDSVLDAAERGFDLTVVDVPCRDVLTDVVRPRVDVEVLLVPARTRAVLAARAMLAAMPAHARIVVREQPGGVSLGVVEEALRRPATAVLPHLRSVAARADNGEPPSLRDAYARSCRTLLADLQDRTRAHARTTSAA